MELPFIHQGQSATWESSSIRPWAWQLTSPSWQVHCTSTYVSCEQFVKRSLVMHATLSSEPSFFQGWTIATDSSPKHRTIFWLNYPVWCALLPDSFSSCLARVKCPTPSVASSTGSTSRSGFVLSCAFSRIVASTEQLLPTCRGTVFRSARSPAGHTSALPHQEISAFRRRTLLPLALGHSRLPVPLHGTVFRLNSMTITSVWWLSEKNWKLICLYPSPKLLCYLVLWNCC